MRLGKNVVWAIGIFVVISIWLASGQFGPRHNGSSGTPAQAASAEKGADNAKPKGKNVGNRWAGGKATDDGQKPEDKTFQVRARKMHAESHAAELVVRGRTQAVRAVSLKSATSGTISKLDVEKGAIVKQGDVICELEPDAREAQLAQAQASLKQSQLEYQGANELYKKGYRSETSVMAAKATLDASSANVRSAEIELGRTKVRAPFDGIVDDRMVEVGDYLQPGGTCARVVDLDPMLVVGQVSERDVVQLSIGVPGHAKLIDGSDHEGRLRFVSTTADPATRTFRVELEVPNADGRVRDGVTADILVPVQAVMAHKISPAILGLDEKGAMGVRIVDAGNVVRFLPVQVIADAGDGVWVSGLPNEATVITVGQEYVVPGQKVDVALEGDGAKS